MITPEEQESLDRLREVAQLHRANLSDRHTLVRLALREHPDDDCDLTRLELIEELDAARERINAMGTLLSHYQTTTCDELGI